MTISNNYVLITGASSGIGRACAEFLASEGVKVYAGARKQDDINKLNKISLPLKSMLLNKTQLITQLTILKLKERV
jgi:NADP-dependent 3-hydroxy acid dehydrogenase YdfG